MVFGVPRIIGALLVGCVWKIVVLERGV